MENLQEVQNQIWSSLSLAGSPKHGILMSLKRKTSKAIKKGEGNMETDFPFKHEDGTGGKQRTQNARL